jgi:hypothetical protein
MNEHESRRERGRRVDADRTCPLHSSFSSMHHPRGFVASTRAGSGGCGRTHRSLQRRLSGSYKGPSRPETGHFASLDSTSACGRACCLCMTQAALDVLQIYLHPCLINVYSHFLSFAAIGLNSLVPPLSCKLGLKPKHALALGTNLHAR